ncbi:MAG: imidazole glycerol phosphate synthase subunit HisF [Bacillota bacterium]
MAVKRIIPCLDLQGGQVVKGVKFVDLKKAGDPIELAIAYEQAGADELALLDIQGKQEARRELLELIKAIKARIKIPLIFGGGVRSVADIKAVLQAGADKVSINSAAIANPLLINEASRCFGSEKIIVAIDAKKTGEDLWRVYIKGGTEDTGLDVVEWAKRVAELGAGEILLTSIDRDGTKLGYDLELTRGVRNAGGVPVIASGGAGELQHLLDGVTLGQADGVLAASIFHFGIVEIKEAKAFFRQRGIAVK